MPRITYKRPEPPFSMKVRKNVTDVTTFPCWRREGRRDPAMENLLSERSSLFEKITKTYTVKNATKMLKRLREDSKMSIDS